MLRQITSILVLALFALTRGASGQAIKLADFGSDPAGVPGERIWKQNIAIGPRVTLDATVNVTVRGNGILHIANLKLKVLDEYDDGHIYIGGLLDVEWVDLTGDGFKDLVITGTMANTGEKGTDPVTYSTITQIYIFDPGKMQYRLAFSHGPRLD